MPRDARERIELGPLSLEAVSSLAGSAARPGREVFEATGGNPFHVTEYLATSEASVPRSVQEATLTRASLLSHKGRRALDCAAIFPRRIDEETLQTLAGDGDHAGVEECLRTGMLEARDGVLAFRHELARRAVHNAMSPLRRRELHAAALALLKARADGRAAEAAHHAEEAGAVEDLVTYSVKAAAEAAALGAPTEARAHLTRALDRGTWLSDGERAELLERKAELGETSGAFESAMAAIQEAIAARRRMGDVLGLGNALRICARLHWQLGESSLAEQRADEAVEAVREHPDTWQYALALSSQSQLDGLADRLGPAFRRGEEAMARAERLERWDIYLHALTSVAIARSAADTEGGLPLIRAAIEEARRRGQPDALPRLYASLTYIMAHDRRYDGLFELIREGIEVADARDNGPLDAYSRGCRAVALLDLGRAEEAIAEAEQVVYGPYPRGTVRFPALVTLSRARVRLGLDEGGAAEQAWALPTSRRDLMRLAPLTVADAEAHWLGLPRGDAVQHLRSAYERMLPTRSSFWSVAEAALWLKILGEAPDVPEGLLRRFSPAHQAHVCGRWREAADAWGRLGCPYEQAIALSEGDEAAQREALALFDRIGARPAAQKLRREMRRRGVRSVPSGPRLARRKDPAGLTPRQAEVLALLAEGLTNSEIAERLNTSAKTAEHHVGAVLAAFDAPNRLRAVQIAAARGLVNAPT